MSTPRERQQADARIQAAALRHYAVMCRDKSSTMREQDDDAVVSRAKLDAWSQRADKLADNYERLELTLL